MSDIGPAVARRCLLGMVSVLTVLAGASPAQSAPAAAAPDVPTAVVAQPQPDPAAATRVGTKIDPALAAVEVASPTLRTTRSAEDRAQGTLDRTIADLTGIKRTLGSLAVVRVQTEASLVEAVKAITVAEEVLRARQVHLRETQAAERTAEERLARARAEVRVVAVAGYMSGTDTSAALFMDDPDKALASGRRRVLGAAVGSDKVARVVARFRDLERAVAVREDAADGVERAVQVLAGARDTQRRVAAELEAVQQRILDATADERRQAEEVYAATLRRDGARLDVLDARVLSMVVGADLALVALDAYWKAAAGSPCPTEWWALAAIGRSESFHGTYGGTKLDATGHPGRKIIGIPLDGSRETAVVSDTDGGVLDGDAVQDRAVGPMQFIPSTWARWGTDGDGDGLKDPHSIYDAASAAARYLCASSGDLSTDPGLRRAYFAYNHSEPYVTTVLGLARAYDAKVEIPPIPPA